MTTARASAEAVCLKHLKALDPSGKHENFYKEFFSGLSNKEFDEWMIKLKNKEIRLQRIVFQKPSKKVDQFAPSKLNINIQPP